MAHHDLGRPVPVGRVQHPALDRLNQLRTGSIHPTPKPFQLVDPDDRILRIVGFHPGGEQLIDRRFGVGQGKRRSRIAHLHPPKIALRTHSLRTAPGRLEIGDRSHGSSLINGCDNEASRWRRFPRILGDPDAVSDASDRHQVGRICRAFGCPIHQDAGWVSAGGGERQRCYADPLAPGENRGHVGVAELADALG